MSVNFADILNVRADTIEAPKTLPPGKYNATVKSFEPGVSTQKKTPYVEIKFNIDGILEVPSEHEDEANAALQSKSGYEMRTSYYLSDKSTYRLTDFLEQHLGISRAGKTLGEMLQASIGESCGVVLDVETSKDGREFITIKRTFKVV
jgi:hypothetical protein